MHNSHEIALLQAIAETHDLGPRLILADWLEETGDHYRADFIRMQCKLQATDIPDDERQVLRLRERQLLDAHRKEWLRAIGLPLEDVTFKGGFVSNARLSTWDRDLWLNSNSAQLLATLTELDLSSLALNDDALRDFVKRAQFPALRKLILSKNDLTDESVPALAESVGFPRLETLYLFQNPISVTGLKLLIGSSRFSLKNLDAGEREDGYCMSSGEAEVARREYIRSRLNPLVARYFHDYDQLQSAMLCVAQYWADEANDAVHGNLIVSELIEPTLDGVEYSEDDAQPDPNLPTVRLKGEYGYTGSIVSIWGYGWDENGGAIPLWSAYAPEMANQDYNELKEAYAPAVIFYRHGGYEFLTMPRPHLSGIRPEED